MTSGYYMKHFRVLPAYVRMSFQKMIEYKFNVLTNVVSVTVVSIVWIFFWSLLLGNVKEIGSWNVPALILLSGFIQLSYSLWQVLWYTIAFREDILTGKLDLYLVRPVHPLFGMVFRELQFFSILSAGVGAAIVAYAITTYYSVNVVNIAFALFYCLIGVSFFHISYSIMNTSTFWFGRLRSPRSIMRSFEIISTYPIDIFNVLVQGFYTFFLPYAFLGTLPARAITTFTLSQNIFYALVGIGVITCWFLVFLFCWKKGLERYESYGG